MSRNRWVKDQGARFGPVAASFGPFGLSKLPLRPLWSGDGPSANSFGQRGQNSEVISAFGANCQKGTCKHPRSFGLLCHVSAGFATEQLGAEKGREKSF